MPERRPHTGSPFPKSWFLNGNRLRFRCSHAHEPFYPKDPLPDRIFLPYAVKPAKSACITASTVTDIRKLVMET